MDCIKLTFHIELLVCLQTSYTIFVSNSCICIRCSPLNIYSKIPFALAGLPEAKNSISLRFYFVQSSWEK